MHWSAVRINNNRLSIGDAAVGGGEHEDDLFVLVYLVEKAVGADSIAPGVWIEAF